LKSSSARSTISARLSVRCDRAQERKLTRIIRKHGIVAPIIVDPNGNIINGVLVWKLCKKLGFDSVPTVVVRTNDPAAVKALRLALNRVAEDAGWDKENLREELKYLLEMVKKQHRPGRVATDRAS
jgi:ParB-like chromosome segregation protein Spo0J